MASARIDTAARDVLLVLDTVAESLNKLPAIIADAALDGSAKDSIKSPMSLCLWRQLKN